MKTIKILGTGCFKCRSTEEVVREVVEKYNVSATIEKVEDFREFAKYDVISFPAVVVDEKVKISGRVPKSLEVLGALS